MSTRTLTLKVSDQLRKQIAAASRRKNISSSELVRRAVQRYVVDPDEEQPGFVSAGELAGDLVGSLKGGPKDLASNPKHLEDYGQ